MTTQIALRDHARGSMIGMRSTVTPLRQRVERALDAGDDVCLDFSGVDVTQSAVDELVGALVLRSGPGVMRNIVLKGCSESTKEILRFVTRDRAAQFAGYRGRQMAFTSAAPVSCAA